MTDTERLTAALDSIVRDYDDALNPTPAGSSGGKNANKKSSRPPLPTESLSIRTEVWEFLASWTRYTTGWWEDTTRLTTAVHMAQCLNHHVTDLATDEIILDELPGLEKLVRQLHLAANPPATRQEAPGRCPEHPDHDLLRDPYIDGQFNCTNDQTAGTVYQWWLRAHPEHDRVVTIADLADYDNVDEAQVRDRLRNARLKPLNPGKRPAIYSLADLEWHREQQRQKRSANT